MGSKSLRLLRNINPYWAISTLICVWFLFIHAPPQLRRSNAHERPLFLLHLAGAYVIYLACVHNTLLKPPQYRSVHSAAGRIGMIGGIIGFVGGFLLVIVEWDHLDPSFAIGITIGGFLQINVQYEGYQAILRYQTLKLERTTTADVAKLAQIQAGMDEALRTHILAMIALFVNACGVPALMRIGDYISPSWWSRILVLFLANQIKLGYGKSLTKDLVIRQQSRAGKAASLKKLL